MVPRSTLMSEKKTFADIPRAAFRIVEEFTDTDASTILTEATLAFRSRAPRFSVI